MNRPDDEARQINLTDREPGELAFQATQDDADSLILLLMAIKGKRSIIDAHLLIHSAINELVRYSSVYIDLRNNFIRVLVRKSGGKYQRSG